MTMATLRRLAKGFNASTSRSMTVLQEEDLERATRVEVLEEERKGCVWFDDDDASIDTKFIGRRFGIRQSEKTSPSTSWLPWLLQLSIFANVPTSRRFLGGAMI